MPREITKTVYTFAELIKLGEEGKITKSAVEKVRQLLIKVQTSHNWWECVYAKWTDLLCDIGFYNVEIQFRGFWSQGDGASFTADVDLSKLISYLASPANTLRVDELIGQSRIINQRLRRLIKIANYIDAGIIRDNYSNYVHEHTSHFRASLENNWERYRKVDNLVAELNVVADKLKLDINRAIYKDLEEEYEYLVSDESLIELAEANDYTFDEYGNRES